MANLGSSSSSSEMRDSVPVMLAGLHVFTSLKMTEGAREGGKRDRKEKRGPKGGEDKKEGVHTKAGKREKDRSRGRVHKTR